VVYNKLIKAARAYDPSKERLITADAAEVANAGFVEVIKDSTIPIAIHEAKSAYYKAKLVKEVTFHTSKGVKGVVKKIFKKKD